MQTAAHTRPCCCASCLQALEAVHRLLDFPGEWCLFFIIARMELARAYAVSLDKANLAPKVALVFHTLVDLCPALLATPAATLRASAHPLSICQRLLRMAVDQECMMPREISACAAAALRDICIAHAHRANHDWMKTIVTRVDALASLCSIAGNRETLGQMFHPPRAWASADFVPLIRGAPGVVLADSEGGGGGGDAQRPAGRKRKRPGSAASTPELCKLGPRPANVRVRMRGVHGCLACNESRLTRRARTSARVNVEAPASILMFCQECLSACNR
ncbi:hypothetical protein JKP88DRAFT_313117 [Tribonema minus]|uniref:Uncharacterized protein n=1 Tax=Tribonema minus TaxID=303371 RepID=A0A835Z844_9STRA|nr:hypothetical protein JKP88DRAFT_313117 [Tribonema minus]